MIDVSVLVPTKDRPDRLERAIAAILAQEGASFEVLINNGGGEIPTFDDPRVTIVDRRTPINGVLNHTAIYASGRLLHVAADDDVMQPGALACAATIKAEWCYGTMQYVQDGVLGAVAGANPWSLAALQQGNICLFPTVFFTRRLFDEVGGFDETLELVGDYEMWARFGSRGYTPEVLHTITCHYELWPGSVTSLRTADIDDEADQLRDRWSAIGFGNRPGDAR